MWLNLGLWGVDRSTICTFWVIFNSKEDIQEQLSLSSSLELEHDLALITQTRRMPLMMAKQQKEPGFLSGSMEKTTHQPGFRAINDRETNLHLLKTTYCIFWVFRCRSVPFTLTYNGESTIGNRWYFEQNRKDPRAGQVEFPLFWKITGRGTKFPCRDVSHRFSFSDSFLSEQINFLL